MASPVIKKAGTIFKGKQTQAQQAYGAAYAPGYPPGYPAPYPAPPNAVPPAVAQAANQTATGMGHVNAAVAFVKAHPVQMVLGAVGALFVASRIFKS